MPGHCFKPLRVLTHLILIITLFFILVLCMKKQRQREGKYIAQGHVIKGMELEFHYTLEIFPFHGIFMNLIPFNVCITFHHLPYQSPKLNVTTIYYFFPILNTIAIIIFRYTQLCAHGQVNISASNS